MRKICIITGTRAEYGLLKPLMKLIDAAEDTELALIITGSHLMDERGHTIDEIAADDFDVSHTVNVARSGDTSADIVRDMGAILAGMAEQLEHIKPDLIVVLGDRFEILAAAEAALLMGIALAHIHGGEITEGAVDDSIRHAITKMADLHFAATDSYVDRIIQLGENPAAVFNVGALGVEAALQTRMVERDLLLRDLGLDPNRDFFIMTWHPETATDINQSQAIATILEALDTVPEMSGIITWPCADSGSDEIIEAIEAYREKWPDRIVTSKSLGQSRYLSAVSHALFVIGNSSSGVIEAPSLKTPTIDIGDRQKGRVRAASVTSCPIDAADIAGWIRKYASEALEPVAYRNPYEQDNTAEAIFQVIRSADLTTLRPKSFYDMDAKPAEEPS